MGRGSSGLRAVAPAGAALARAAAAGIGDRLDRSQGHSEMYFGQVYFDDACFTEWGAT